MPQSGTRAIPLRYQPLYVALVALWIGLLGVFLFDYSFADGALEGGLGAVVVLGWQTLADWRDR